MTADGSDLERPEPPRLHGDRAIAALQQSLDNAPRDPVIEYNAACFYALEGMTDKSLDCLENCLVKVGNISREWLEHDSDLDAIRDHPRYAGIIAAFPE